MLITFLIIMNLVLIGYILINPNENKIEKEVCDNLAYCKDLIDKYDQVYKHFIKYTEIDNKTQEEYKRLNDTCKEIVEHSKQVIDINNELLSTFSDVAEEKEKKDE